jgi:predicted  nucleic acid-binding Zn-ribbon protein
MIKKFKNFISEKISVLDVDKPSVASTANHLNDLESHIKEFNTKKVDLENIYKLSVNEKDIVRKLSARKFINPVSSKSQMEFINPLLGKYARVCDLKKQISDLEKEQSEVDKSVKGKESEIGSNPSMKDSLLNDIQSKKTDTERIKTKLQELRTESDRLERLTMKELQEIQKEIQTGTREVRQDRSMI